MDSHSSSRRYESNTNSHRREQVSINIPPMRYKLTKLTQAQTLYQIAMKTSGFYDMSVKSADWIQRDVRSRDFSSFGTLKVPEDMKLVDIIAGENDYYLKLTMKKHDIDYICYDGEDNQFQFWGEYQCCIRAMNELRYRIAKVSQREGSRQWPISNGGASSQYNDSYGYDEYERDEEYGRDSKRPREDMDNVASKQEKYSKFATNQMNKMGFQPSHGLGRNNTGRVEPIDPVSELGGRVSNKLFGFGFSGMLKVDQNGVIHKVGDETANQVESETPQIGFMRSISMVDSEAEQPPVRQCSIWVSGARKEQPSMELSRSMSCTYYDEEPPSDLMSALSIVPEEEVVRSMSTTADSL